MEVSGSVFCGGLETCVRHGGNWAVFQQPDFSLSVQSFGRSVPGHEWEIISSGLRRHQAMFSGEQNAILSSSCVTTALITATIFDPSVLNIKVVISVTFSAFYSAGFFFSPIFPLSLIEQSPEMWWGHGMQKVICLSFFPNDSEACEQQLSQLLINEAGANVWSDLLEEKESCADITVVVWVNFHASSCI